MKILSEQFREWYIENGSPGNLAEREIAFMSGAAAMFFAMCELSNLSESKSEQAIEVLDRELQDYFKLLGKVPSDISKS